MESELERRRPAGRADFVDAVTFAWADRDAQLYGFTRLGIAQGGGSALGVAFSGREPVGVIAQGNLEVPGGEDWSLAMAEVEMRVVEPLSVWELEAAMGEARVELRFEALGPPAVVDADGALPRGGGMEGYEQACRVSGTAQVRDRDVSIAGVGQRGHQWGAPDWDRIALARTVSAWTDTGEGVALSAVRPAKAKAHDGEAMWAALLGDGAEIADPRLSTTYDGDGRQLRAGLELWMGEDDPYPRRATGEAICGSTLDLGQLRLDCAFFAWNLDGREAVGRYDVLRRA